MIFFEFFLLHLTKSIFGVFRSKRVINKDVGLIEMCSFISLKTDDSGGAIFISASDSTSLEVQSSYFEGCVANLQGGCIFLKSKLFLLCDSCFDTCESNDPNDNDFGVVIFSSNEDIHSQRNAFFLCGYPESQIGDSTQYFAATNNLKLEYLNDTSCNNKWGSSGPYLRLDSAQRAIANYITITDARGRHIFGNYGSSPSDVSYLNFVNISAYGAQIFSKAEMCFFNSYLFFMSDIDQFDRENTFTDCYGNFKKEGVIFCEDAVTAGYHVKRADGCIFLSCTKRNKIHVHKSIILSVNLIEMISRYFQEGKDLDSLFF